MSVKYYCLCLFSVCFLFSSALHADTNVLINPGFETGDTTGWSPRGCPIEAVDSPVHSGSYSARAYDRTANWNGIEQDLMGKIVEGQVYQISGYIMLENASIADANVQCTVQQTVDGDTTYNYVDGATADDSGWTLLSGAFTPNESGGLLTQLSVYFESADPEASFFVDDASVFGPEVTPPEPNASGLVDINVRHQIIEGFGASGAWYENWLTYHPKSEEIYDLLFDDLGLDIYRIRNTYDYTDDYGYMDNTAVIVNAALQRKADLKTLITAWSPAEYLKSTGQLNSGTIIGGPNDYAYDDYAQWWYDSVVAWSSYGVDTDYISIQNEPDYNGNDRCLMQPTESEIYAGYNQAFETVWQKLNAEMDSSMPKMIGPETSGFSGASGYSLDDYLSAIIDHNHVYGYAHHLYNCYNGGPPGCGDAPDMYLGNMIGFNSDWDGKLLFQTEYEHATDYWPDALNMALLLHNSLTVEEVSVYLYWDLFWSNGGLVTLDNPWSGPDPGYTINSDYYGFKHYSAFIFDGWQRIDASTDNSSVRISAYISPDSNNMTCVLINTAPETDIETDLDFGEFPLRLGDVYRSSQTENCELVGSYNGTEPLMLPAESVTTLALQANIPPVAVAGPNQSVYAFVNGWADVNMDGSGSYDEDEDPLSYHWSWSINGSDYEATGVSPTISLPAGVHTIELVVDDGIMESQPDYCTVNVTAPLESRMFFIPGALRENHCRGVLFAKISLPTDVNKSDIDKTVLPFMYPGGKECWRQFILIRPRRLKRCTYILALFRKSDCTEELEQGINKIIVGGKLKSGRYYKATGYLWFIETRRGFVRPYLRWRRRYLRWFRWKTDEL